MSASTSEALGERADRYVEIEQQSPSRRAVLDQGHEHLLRRHRATPARCELEHALRLRRDPEAARLRPDVVPEALLELAAHRLERDAERGERVTLVGANPLADVVGRHVVLFEYRAERGAREHQMLDADGERELGALEAGARVDLLRRVGRPREKPHQRLFFDAYFLCTACFDTPSSSAMSCHECPLRRAFSTWSRSRRSSRRRSAATARSPASGSSDATCTAKSLASSIRQP